MRIISVDRKKEIIEIENESSKSVDISLWKLLDSEKFKYPFPKYRHKFIFPKNTVLKASESIKIHTFSGKNTKTDLYQNRKAPMWNNESDVAILLDKNDNLISRYPQQALRTISGYVYKAGVKSGISGAGVAATLTANPNAPGKSTKTDNNGYYLLDNLAPAKYKVTISKDGFVSESKIIDVTKDDVNQDFYLEVSSSELKVIVDKIEIIPAQPDWNKNHKIKTTFKNRSDDFYHFETNLKLKWPQDANYSDVPGTSKSSDDTYEKDESWDITFTSLKDGWFDWQGWHWYEKDGAGFAKEKEISRKIQYRVWFKAIRQEDEPAFEDTKEFETTIKVSQGKRDALNEYNKYLAVFEAATATATALTLAGVAAAAGIITAVGAPPLFVAAAIAGAAATAAKLKADYYYEIINDP